jgi:hypothetical protein
MRPPAVVAIASFIVLLAPLAACVRVTVAPSPAAVAPPAVAAAPPAVVSAAPPPAALEPPPVAATSAPSPAAVAPPAVAAPPVALAPPPAASTPPAPVPSPAPKTVSKAPPPPTLDLASLEARLRATGAIGVFTKLSLKNQVSDLLDQFKTFHRDGVPALPVLRQQYDLLLLKVLSLLQDDDASLASAISASRESIWGLLVDPAKFAKLG